MPIVDTWWQTETGGAMISSLAGVTEQRASFAGRPLPGVFPLLLDEQGREIQAPNRAGNLCIKDPWPGMARTIYGDRERFKQTYFTTYPGHYFTGDGCLRDESGLLRITGRVDDVINVSGHRIGTAEVEDAINQNKKVVESAVVGIPHPLKGQSIYAYVVSTQEDAPNSSEKCGHRPGTYRALCQTGSYPNGFGPAQNPLGKNHASNFAQDCRGQIRRPGRLVHPSRHRRSGKNQSCGPLMPHSHQIDRLGIAISLLCLAHCLLGPYSS